MPKNRKAGGLHPSAYLNSPYVSQANSKPVYRNYEIFAATRLYLAELSEYLLQQERLAYKAGLTTQALNKEVLAIINCVRGHYGNNHGLQRRPKPH